MTDPADVRAAWLGAQDSRETLPTDPDVVARLNAAGAALEAAQPYSCAGGDLRAVARALRLMSSDVQEAVSDALRRP